MSKILSPGSASAGLVAPRPVLAKLILGKQSRRPLLLLADAALRRRLLRATATGAPTSTRLRELYRRRRDVMLDALAEQLPAQARWTRPQGGLFIWVTLPDYIDTTDLLARALARERRVRARVQAAFVDGRGHSSMRLNFSSSTEDQIREGVRRIGAIVAEQVALYDTLTGAAHRRGRGRRRRLPRRPSRDGRRGARCRDASARRRRSRPRGMTRVAVLKGGRSLERQVSLASGARVEDALERLGHEVVGIDVGTDLVARLREARPDVAFVALHGRGGEDGTVQELLEVLEIPYTGSGVHACVRCSDKVLAKHALRDGGLPTPDWVALGEIAFSELGAAEALAAIEQRLGFPLVVKPASQGSSFGVTFARSRDERARGADRRASPTAARCCSSATSRGASSRCRCSPAAAAAAALPIVEAVPRGRDFYDFAARYDIGRTEFVCPAELDDGVAERVAGDRAGGVASCSAAAASRAST